jgi:ankyrin repeat protein
MDPDLPNWQQMRPLHHLAQHGDVETARLFLDFGADPSAIDEEYRSTPLGWAARCGQREFVRFLLQQEAEQGQGAGATEAPLPAWATAIEWARRRGHGEILALLHEAAPR